MKRQRREKPGTNPLDPSTLPVKKVRDSSARPLKKARALPEKAWLSTAVDSRRVRCLTTTLTKPKPEGQGVVCLLQRDLRLQDNWALLFAQGLEEFAQDLLEANIGFLCIPIIATEDDASMKEATAAVAASLEKLDPSVVVCDLMPLRRPTQLTGHVADVCLQRSCPLFQVDAHNVVPVWLASSKQEYSARTFRPHVLGFLNEFAGDIPRMQKHPHKCQPDGGEKFNMSSILSTLKYDEKVILPKRWTPGTKAGFAALHEFCTKPRLSEYASRNNPAVAGQSGLSPWLHFGQLSTQRCVFSVRKLGPGAKLGAAAAAMRDSFIEELVVRRELAENFIFYNPEYDKVEGAHRWAQDTLAAHQRDKREHVYSLAEFEDAKTHDELWNASQLQLVQEAKMHGFLRMYWAKKVLQWSQTPESALETSLYLNDKYSLDGTDPNGVVGCMWSIAGVHDQGWGERPVFGKIRYMNLAGCRRKFPVDAFVKRFPTTTRMPVTELLAKKSKLTRSKAELYEA